MNEKLLTQLKEARDFLLLYNTNGKMRDEINKAIDLGQNIQLPGKVPRKIAYFYFGLLKGNHKFQPYLTQSFNTPDLSYSGKIGNFLNLCYRDKGALGELISIIGSFEQSAPYQTGEPIYQPNRPVGGNTTFTKLFPQRGASQPSPVSTAKAATAAQKTNQPTNQQVKQQPSSMKANIRSLALKATPSNLFKSVWGNITGGGQTSITPPSTPPQPASFSNIPTKRGNFLRAASSAITSIPGKIPTSAELFIHKYTSKLMLARLITGGMGGLTGFFIFGSPAGIAAGAFAGASVPNLLKRDITVRGGGRGINNKISAAKKSISLIKKARTVALLANPWVLAAVSIAGFFLFITFLTLIKSGPLTMTNLAESAPIPPLPTGGDTLGYFIPFRDSSVMVINPDAIKNEIKSNWPNAKLENWDIIIQKSIERGWNPAFVLTLWIEESGAQGATSYTDALGCAPNQPTTDINISLKCLFDNFDSYTNNRFADFMCMYSESRQSPCQFFTNPNFPKNIKAWYAKLVPSGNGAIVIITPPPVPTLPPAPDDIDKALLDKFGIKMSGYDRTHKVWAYDKFSQIITITNSTHYKDLINGTIINAVASPADTAQVACQVIQVYPFNEELFKVAITHELGHIIRNCTAPRNNICYYAHLEVWDNGKNPVTNYSKTACTYPSSSRGWWEKTSEDYAEMLTYYLNPGVDQQTAACAGRSANPYANGAHSAHWALADKIIKGSCSSSQ